MATIDKYISDKASSWKGKAIFRKENEKWIEKSATIALRVLRELREKSLSQKELADKMNVSAQYISKLIKGRENLSLDTICKLEEALDITLISVPQCTLSLSVPFTASSETIIGARFDQKKTYTDITDWSVDGMWVKMDNAPKKTA